MRKIFSLTAGLAAVALATAVAAPANAVTGGTTAPAAGPNVAIITPDGYEKCSGTLINLWMVLTAWHCVDQGTPGTIQWGNTTWRKGKKVSFSTVVHEDDLALIYLAEDIPFGEVAYPSLGTEDPRVGDTVQFFGFGRDDSGDTSPVLRTGSAIVTPPLNDGRGDALWGPSWSTQKNGNGNPALGDSGGGAYLNGKLVGVTSRSSSTQTNYASVAAHLSFLNEELK